MFELITLFLTRHQRAEHAAKYNKYRKGYQTGRCKELTPQQQLVARRKRDVGYLTLLIVGALGAGAAFNSLSDYNPHRSTSSVSVERSVSVPDPRSQTATEVAGGFVLDNTPQEFGGVIEWSTSLTNQPDVISDTIIKCVELERHITCVARDSEQTVQFAVSEESEAVIIPTDEYVINSEFMSYDNIEWNDMSLGYYTLDDNQLNITIKDYEREATDKFVGNYSF